MVPPIRGSHHTLPSRHAARRIRTAAGRPSSPGARRGCSSGWSSSRWSASCSCSTPTSLAVLAEPAIILFVAWLMSYVLEPPVSLVQRHLPFRGRGVAVAITYLVTAVVAFVVIAGAGVAVINAAVAFIDNLPTILSRLGEILTPVVERPRADARRATARRGRQDPGFLAENAARDRRRITALARNAIVRRGQPHHRRDHLGRPGDGPGLAARLAAAVPAVEHLSRPDRAGGGPSRSRSAGSSAAGCVIGAIYGVIIALARGRARASRTRRSSPSSPG